MRKPPALRDLDAASARLCLRIEKFCLERLGLKAGASLLLAVSGGADSTALAVIFSILSSRLQLDLQALHINHGLRESAAADAEFVANICAWLRMPCEIASIDTKAIAAKNSCGIEEAGRIGRYEKLYAFKEQWGADHILLGHQADDLCEDIIMRLIRGAGWPAIGGMKTVQGAIMRPLLEIDAPRLKKFLQAMDIGWREDESNSSMEFRRNRVRHQCLPFLREENPAIAAAMLNLHTFARLDAEFWDAYLENALYENPWRESEDGQLLLPEKLLAQMHPAARLRLYLKAAVYLRGKRENGRGQTRGQTLIKLDEAFAKGRMGKQFQLFADLAAYTSKNGIIFRFGDNQVFEKKYNKDYGNGHFRSGGIMEQGSN